MVSRYALVHYPDRFLIREFCPEHTFTWPFLANVHNFTRQKLMCPRCTSYRSKASFASSMCVFIKYILFHYFTTEWLIFMLTSDRLCFINSFFYDIMLVWENIFISRMPFTADFIYIYLHMYLVKLDLIILLKIKHLHHQWRFCMVGVLP